VASLEKYPIAEELCSKCALECAKAVRVDGRCFSLENERYRYCTRQFFRRRDDKVEAPRLSARRREELGEMGLTRDSFRRASHRFLSFRGSSFCFGQITKTRLER
jgi:hypothetical protein